MKRAAADLVSAINVTPLVDVCLVLLIIFMVLTPLIVDRVALPESSTAGPHPEKANQIAVVVNADGTVYLGSLVIRMEQLRGELRSTYERLPDAEIVVRADRRLKYGAVMDVLRECREAGFREVGIITTKRS